MYALQEFENGAFWTYGSYGNFIADYKDKYETVVPIKSTEKIIGKSATVDADITYKNDRKERQTYYLTKEDGKWKIAK